MLYTFYTILYIIYIRDVLYKLISFIYHPYDIFRTFSLSD